MRIFILIFFYSLALALVKCQEFTCPEGRSGKKIILSPGDYFSYLTNDGDKYSPKTKCVVIYKAHIECTAGIRFSCSSFDLHTADPVTCSWGDVLILGRKGYCGMNGPEPVTLTGRHSRMGLRVEFLSDKKKQGGGAKCTAQCLNGATPEMIIRTGGRDRATGAALFEADGSFVCELPRLLDGSVNGLPQHRGRAYHTQTGLMACGGTREGGAGNDDGTRGKTCVTLSGGEWIHSKNFTYNRMGHSAWKTSKGVYLIGGRNTDTTTELLTDTGVQLQPFNLRYRHFVGCAIGFEDKVVLTGGHGATSRVVAYNESGWVEDLPNLNQYRWEHGCGHFINSDNKMVYMVAGGAKGGSSSWADYLDSTEILVEGDSSWTTVGAVKPGVRRGPSIINLNNKVFMFGGNGNLPQNILEFDKDTLEWKIIGEKGLGWEGGLSVVLRETADYCLST